MIKPDIYIQEAVKLENSKSVYEYMIKDLTLQRYEKISELYEKAGNIYKMTDKILSIDCMVKSYNYLIQTDYSFNSYKIKKLAGEIAELYKQIDFSKSIEYLEKVLNYYTIQGDVLGVIKTHEQIGEIYFDNEHFGEAKKIYFKIIELVNSSSKSFDVKKTVVEKLGEIYCRNESTISVNELSNLYFSVGDDYLKKNNLMSKSLAKKYIFIGLLMDLASNDFVKAKNNLNKYSSMYSILTNSNEDMFMSGIFDAVDTNDSEKISILSTQYNKITILTNLQVKLLLQIKANIDGFGDIDLCDDNNNNDTNDYNVIEEDDLC